MPTSPFTFRRACASRFLRLALLALVPLTLVACSLGRIGYNNGDTLVYWWLNGYVDFDSSQRPWVQQRIEGLHAWHRHTQLQTYVPLLIAAQHRLEHNVTKAEVLADYEDMTKCVDRIVDQAAPDLADLAIAMDADNLAQLTKKFESNNDKFRKEYMSGDREERQVHRYKMIMEWAEYWFGDFSDVQQAVIRRISDARPLNNELWVTDRIQRQHALIALLARIHQEKLTHDAAAALIKDFIDNNYLVRTGATPEMKAFFDASKDGVAQLAATIVNLATPKQKEHAKEKLQQWIDDITALEKG
ncbi:MAG TPA: DUF6279 family lipoprotein [Burkholderiaceae bacterium]